MKKIIVFLIPNRKCQLHWKPLHQYLWGSDTSSTLTPSKSSREGQKFPVTETFDPFMVKDVHNLAHILPAMARHFCAVRNISLVDSNCLSAEDSSQPGLCITSKFYWAVPSPKISASHHSGGWRDIQALSKDIIKRENTWVFSSGHFHSWKCVSNSLAHCAW